MSRTAAAWQAKEEEVAQLKTTLSKEKDEKIAKLSSSVKELKSSLSSKETVRQG